jgi:hypothetical protein
MDVLYRHVLPSPILRCNYVVDHSIDGLFRNHALRTILQGRKGSTLKDGF